MFTNLIETFLFDSLRGCFINTSASDEPTLTGQVLSYPTSKDISTVHIDPALILAFNKMVKDRIEYLNQLDAYGIIVFKGEVDVLKSYLNSPRRYALTREGLRNYSNSSSEFKLIRTLYASLAELFLNSEHIVSKKILTEEKLLPNLYSFSHNISGMSVTSIPHQPILCIDENQHNNEQLAKLVKQIKKHCCLIPRNLPLSLTGNLTVFDLGEVIQKMQTTMMTVLQKQSISNPDYKRNLVADDELRAVWMRCMKNLIMYGSVHLHWNSPSTYNNVMAFAWIVDSDKNQSEINEIRHGLNNFQTQNQYPTIFGTDSETVEVNSSTIEEEPDSINTSQNAILVLINKGDNSPSVPLNKYPVAEFVKSYVKKLPTKDFSQPFSEALTHVTSLVIAKDTISNTVDSTSKVQGQCTEDSTHLKNLTIWDFLRKKHGLILHDVLFHYSDLATLSAAKGLSDIKPMDVLLFEIAKHHSHPSITNTAMLVAATLSEKQALYPNATHIPLDGVRVSSLCASTTSQLNHDVDTTDLNFILDMLSVVAPSSIISFITEDNHQKTPGDQVFCELITSGVKSHYNNNTSPLDKELLKSSNKSESLANPIQDTYLDLRDNGGGLVTKELDLLNSLVKVSKDLEKDEIGYVNLSEKIKPIPIEAHVKYIDPNVITTSPEILKHKQNILALKGNTDKESEDALNKRALSNFLSKTMNEANLSGYRATVSDLFFGSLVVERPEEQEVIFIQKVYTFIEGLLGLAFREFIFYQKEVIHHFYRAQLGYQLYQQVKAPAILHFYINNLYRQWQLDTPAPIDTDNLLDEVTYPSGLSEFLNSSINKDQIGPKYTILQILDMIHNPRFQAQASWPEIIMNLTKFFKKFKLNNPELIIQDMADFRKKWDHTSLIQPPSIDLQTLAGLSTGSTGAVAYLWSLFQNWNSPTINFNFNIDVFVKILKDCDINHQNSLTEEDVEKVIRCWLEKGQSYNEEQDDKKVFKKKDHILLLYKLFIETIGAPGSRFPDAFDVFKSPDTIRARFMPDKVALQLPVWALYQLQAASLTIEHYIPTFVNSLNSRIQLFKKDFQTSTNSKRSEVIWRFNHEMASMLLHFFAIIQKHYGEPLQFALKWDDLVEAFKADDFFSWFKTHKNDIHITTNLIRILHAYGYLFDYIMTDPRSQYKWLSVQILSAFNKVMEGRKSLPIPLVGLKYGQADLINLFGLTDVCTDDKNILDSISKDKTFDDASALLDQLKPFKLSNRNLTILQSLIIRSFENVDSLNHKDALPLARVEQWVDFIDTTQPKEEQLALHSGPISHILVYQDCSDKVALINRTLGDFILSDHSKGLLGVMFKFIDIVRENDKALITFNKTGENPNDNISTLMDCVYEPAAIANISANHNEIGIEPGLTPLGAKVPIFRYNPNVYVYTPDSGTWPIQDESIFSLHFLQKREIEEAALTVGQTRNLTKAFRTLTAKLRPLDLIENSTAGYLYHLVHQEFNEAVERSNNTEYETTPLFTYTDANAIYNRVIKYRWISILTNRYDFYNSFSGDIVKERLHSGYNKTLTLNTDPNVVFGNQEYETFGTEMDVIVAAQQAHLRFNALDKREVQDFQKMDHLIKRILALFRLEADSTFITRDSILKTWGTLANFEKYMTRQNFSHHKNDLVQHVLRRYFKEWSDKHANRVSIHSGINPGLDIYFYPEALIGCACLAVHYKSKTEKAILGLTTNINRAIRKHAIIHALKFQLNLYSSTDCPEAQQLLTQYEDVAINNVNQELDAFNDQLRYYAKLDKDLSTEDSLKRLLNTITTIRARESQLFPELHQVIFEHDENSLNKYGFGIVLGGKPMPENEFKSVVLALPALDFVMQSVGQE